MRSRAWVLGLLLLRAAPAAEADELLFPPAGGGAITAQIPLPVTIGGTGTIGPYAPLSCVATNAAGTAFTTTASCGGGTASDVVCTACVSLTTEVSGILPGPNGGLGVAQPVCAAGERLTCTGTSCSCAVPSDLVCTACVNLTTEVSGILPGANGGVGAAQPTCAASELLTCNGTSCTCAARSATVTGDTGSATVGTTGGGTLAVAGLAGITTTRTASAVEIRTASQESAFLTNGGTTSLVAGAVGAAQVMNAGHFQWVDGGGIVREAWHIPDNQGQIVDDVDPTKIATFQAAGITTATTRTYTLPNASGTLAISATSPLVLDASTGALSCPTCNVSAADITAVGNCTAGACFQLETANTVLAGPTSGAASLATMRFLVDADVPNDLTVASSADLATAGKVQIGSLTAGLASCVARDSGTDRLYGDLNCSGTKDLGEEFLDQTPGGATTQIQFNNAGTFGGDADFTWNATTNRLSLAGSTATATLNIAGTADLAQSLIDSGLILNVSATATGMVTPQTFERHRQTMTTGVVDPSGTIGTEFQTTFTQTTAALAPAGSLIATKYNADVTRQLNSVVLPLMSVVTFGGSFANDSGGAADTIDLASFAFTQNSGTLSTLNMLHMTIPTIVAGSITNQRGLLIDSFGGKDVIRQSGATDTNTFGGRMIVGTTSTFNTAGGDLGVDTAGISPVIGVAGTVLPIGFYLTNNAGATVSADACVIIATAASNAFTTTVTADDPLITGVLRAATSAAAIGMVERYGLVTVTVNGTVNVGDYISTSTTAGQCKGSATAPTNRSAILGRALTARSGAGASSVKVLLAGAG